jgi:hypothetical protein
MATLRHHLAPIALVLAACAGGQRLSDTQVSEQAAPAVIVEASQADDEIARTIEADASEGVRRIEEYFGAEAFVSPPRVRVFPGRAELDAYVREAWGLEGTECWMVGAAEEEALILLSPRVWREEACDHDPGDPNHVRDLVAHELVHVYHMQRNPTRAFESVEGLDWFVEGLATLVSGQYERFHVERAREAVASGAAPAQLADAWSGRYRYGVSGSLVAYVETRVGKGGVARLLTATRLDEALSAVGDTEAEFLAAWAAWVSAGDSHR